MTRAIRRVLALAVAVPVRAAPALCALALAAPGLAAPALADPWRALVAEGERLWTHSPDPTSPVACATCHHEADAVRGWAPSFPKFRPLPPPHARVMTLLQATAEAVALHYGEREPRPAALAITAYLTELGAGQPFTPGIAPGQPVLEHRLAALADSVTRGARHHARHCASCHDAASVAPAALDPARLVRTRGVLLEVLLETHDPAGGRLAWDSAGMADLMAYLAAAGAGGRSPAPSRTSDRR